MKGSEKVKKRRYKIRYDNIALLVAIITFIILIIDVKKTMDLILYNPSNKGLTVFIKIALDIYIIIKAVFYTIEKKTL